MSDPTKANELGKVVGLNQERPWCVDNYVRITGDISCSLDILLTNAMGEKKLIRVPVGKDIADFFSGSAWGAGDHYQQAQALATQQQVQNAGVGSEQDRQRAEQMRKLEAEQRAYEASLKTDPVGTCPECHQPQYRNTSGVACRNGHGYGVES